MTVLEYLWDLPWPPCSRDHAGTYYPTRGEFRRWCRRSSVRLNGRLVTEDEEITFPVWELVFWPKSARSRTTMQEEGA